MGDDTELELGAFGGAPETLLAKIVEGKSEFVAFVPFPLQEELLEEEVENKRDFNDFETVVTDATYKLDKRKNKYMLQQPQEV